MTDLKQLERDTHHPNGLNEHGSYCECIWCLEGETAFDEASALAQDASSEPSIELLAQSERQYALHK